MAPPAGVTREGQRKARQTRSDAVHIAAGYLSTRVIKPISTHFLNQRELNSVTLKQLVLSGTFRNALSRDLSLLALHYITGKKVVARGAAGVVKAPTFPEPVPRHLETLL